ncbi:adenylyl cyclase-associated protein 1-like [Tropilaelaps mercedesae]|uniref:Adenylyl cyclase-associated protein 1-like n=1 Tax=Tropilaelaps mercedesae TaxID=418985 RepID=A0A1V9XPK9_9ACAR|nr:adenylyl cyclase-associated protein 1-like [Tropilaelaps mercedesae]
MSRSQLLALFSRLARLDCYRAELGKVDPSTMSVEELNQLVGRLESVLIRLESVEARSFGDANAPPDEDVAAFVAAYDEIVSGPFADYLCLSSQIGGEVAEHAFMVEACFKLQRTFIQAASKSKKPSTEELMTLLKPQSDSIQSIQAFREAKRTSKLFNHLSAISESIPALGWVAVAPTPGPHVKEMADACQFYTNRVLMEYKNTDKTHVEWTKSWLAVLARLQAYIKQYHTTGLSWHPKGGSAALSIVKGGPGGGAQAPLPPPAGMPPPPPPPSDDFMLRNTSAAGGDGDPRAALFASINKGSEITKGLKSVSADQMTHKNPSLRNSSLVPAKGSSASGAASITPKHLTIKPPRCELDGKKWIVEYYRNNPMLELTNVQMNQVIYIYGCQNSVVLIKGKCNSISVDNCKKTSVVFDDIVSTVEFINCQSVKAQAMGKVPTVSIDKTDGAHIYLSSSCTETEVVTSKSSEVNVSVPQGTEGDYVECPIPEQFKSTWNGKSMKTEILDIAA